MVVQEEEVTRGRAEVYNTQTIYITSDYEMFSPFKAQPKLRAEKNMKNIKDSIIRTKGNIVPIEVNRDFEVVNGNTRLLTCKTYKLPIKFVVRSDEEISDAEFMKEVNIAQKQMTQRELVESLANIDGPKYVKYKDLDRFMKSIDKRYTLAMLAKFESKISGYTLKDGTFDNVDYARLKRRTTIVIRVHNSFGNLQTSLSALCNVMGILMNIGLTNPGRLIHKIDVHGDLIFRRMKINKITDIPNMKRFLQTAYNYKEKAINKVDIFNTFEKTK